MKMIKFISLITTHWQHRHQNCLFLTWFRDEIVMYFYLPLVLELGIKGTDFQDRRCISFLTISTMVAPKILPSILLYWHITSEVDDGCVAVEIEPITHFCIVTDNSLVKMCLTWKWIWSRGLISIFVFFVFIIMFTTLVTTQPPLGDCQSR